MASNGSEAPRPPVIGLSTYVEEASFGVWHETAALLPYSYVSAVSRSGGTPVLLPPSGSSPARVIALLDGLVLTGGPDVEPALYGESPHPETDRPRRDRDAWEIALCRQALEAGLPLLAVCRGAQVLNVALGGTLHQHLPEIVGHDDHRRVIGQTSPNLVRLDARSSVAAVLGVSCTGRCHHHQAIDRLGEGLEAVGFAEDGSVEAIEVKGSPFALGVQWHPEDNPDDDRLFAALAASAVSFRAGGGTGQVLAGAPRSR